MPHSLPVSGLLVRNFTCVHEGTGLFAQPLTKHMVSDNLPFVVTNREADGLSVLGDRTRRAIFESLSERPRAVGELADALPVSRPAVSQHLKVLKSAGLVTEHAEGTRRIYRLNPDGVAAMRDQLDTFWNRALSGYAQVTEEQATEEQATEEPPEEQP